MDKEFYYNTIKEFDGGVGCAWRSLGALWNREYLSAS